MLVTNGNIHKKVVNALKYAAFVGNITEVIEININEVNKPIKTYIAGKTYSQALSSAKLGLNSKLLTVISGLRKNESDGMIAEAKNNNIDTSHIFISNDIDNDIKIIYKDENNNKIKEEDILKGSADALSEDIIVQNEEMLKKSSIIVFNTKINKNVIKKLVQISIDNNIPTIIVPSRPNEISIIENDIENIRLIDKVSIIICNKNQFYQIFGQDVSIEEYLKKYSNKLILIDDYEVKYFNGNKIIYSKDENLRLKEVGAEDIFIGGFVNYFINSENIAEAIKDGLSSLKLEN